MVDAAQPPRHLRRIGRSPVFVRPLRVVRPKVLRFHAAVRTIDCESNLADDRDGRYATIRSGFWPVVCDPPVAADRGNLPAILTINGLRNHVRLPLSAATPCGFGRYIGAAHRVPDGEMGLQYVSAGILTVTRGQKGQAGAAKRTKPRPAETSGTVAALCRLIAVEELVEDSVHELG
jgi:hypothetical protein